MNTTTTQKDPQTNTQNQGLLRFITAGSVDDGKSTLIGRLLYDSKNVFVDQLHAVTQSKHNRSYDNSVDLALLTDGLEAEREQGITIDVAYRYFATPQRKYIIADTPGHEQYTRNMVTGASTAHAAIILIDAGKLNYTTTDSHGHIELLTQTKRHSALLALLGVQHIIVAINKMDLIDYDPTKYQQILQAYAHLAQRIGITNYTPLPLSALKGDNVVHPSQHMNWYTGPALLQLLDNLPIPDQTQQPLRFPVQTVVRHDGSKKDDFRGYAGRIETGTIHTGDTITIQPQNRTTTITGIHSYDGTHTHAHAGQSITLTLADNIDISRGDWINSHSHPAQIDKQRPAHLCWFSEEPMALGRKYLIKHGTRTAPVRINTVDYQLNIHTLDEHQNAHHLEMNGIARIQLQLQQALPIDPYTTNKAGGAFILIDETTNQTIAGGMFI